MKFLLDVNIPLGRNAERELLNCPWWSNESVFIVLEKHNRREHPCTLIPIDEWMSGNDITGIHRRL